MLALDCFRMKVGMININLIPRGEPRISTDLAGLGMEAFTMFHFPAGFLSTQPTFDCEYWSVIRTVFEATCYSQPERFQLSVAP